MRVVAGALGGRRLRVPSGRATPGKGGTRPTTDLVRGALFNALEALGAVSGASVVDLFAGSGALGIEALSRGAASAVFVERAPAALSVLEENLGRLGLARHATVLAQDALDWARHALPVDLALVDPPYTFDDWDSLLSALPAALVACESDREVIAPARWQLVKTKRYGSTVVTLLQAMGAFAG